MTTNAEWVLRQGIKFSDLRLKSEHIFAYLIKDKTGKALGIIDNAYNEAEALKKWLDAEHTGPILDDVERRYLSAVIRPFRDRAIFVKKTHRKGLDNASYEQIVIRVKSIATDIADIPFPFFKEGEMYKGMTLEWEYTLEELEIE